TDRCDFRCVYCMDEEMTFVPRQKVLTLEEMHQVAEAFVELGVGKIRLTGGEPLVRANVMSLCESVGALPGLDELVMTTNGSQLSKVAKSLLASGVKRLNISLDTLKADKFKELTRVGDLEKVLQGIDAAIDAGFEKIKLNAVIMKGRNADEVIPLIRFAVGKGIDISFIEEMPLGVISEHSREEAFCSNQELKEIISEVWPLQVVSTGNRSDGPSRYYQLPGEKTRIGFISPHSHNFCGDCNRVRVTAEGLLLLCLGNEHAVDLRAVLRAHPGDRERLKRSIIEAMDLKPERHEFNLSEEPQIVRFMNMTG
ncbi:cyclic pyranopterin phosphate synthase, partial [Oleiphilus sp. HI0050]